MAIHLLITVRLHDGRYHGWPEWPPSPARLFQALVSGVGLRDSFCEVESGALAWLERRARPTIGVPVTRDGQRVMFYMPNNDLDSVGCDPSRIAEVRTAKKFFRPRIFDATVPFLYAWSLDLDDEAERQAQAICSLSEQLFQFGRGVDMAWALGEVLDDEKIEARLSHYVGLVYRPAAGGSGRQLACPKAGSLASLQARYAAGSRRFTEGLGGRTTGAGLTKPPEPDFEGVPYDSPPSRRVYELRATTSEAAFAIWPLAQAATLVVWLRDGAVNRLRNALPDRTGDIECVLVGRKPNGADEGPTGARVRIVPLPSIGHHHIDLGIRRVLVEVPAGCPLRADDVHGAFSNLDLCDPNTGEVRDVSLTRSEDTSMLSRYGASDSVRSRVWRTVTPVALPDPARRRRIEPTRMGEEAKGGTERAAEQARAAAAVAQALRHADVRTRADMIRVQREPFEAKGERVESFSRGTRFEKERLWHVEITFNAPVVGPLVIGDGRFLGLGLMAPVQLTQGVHAFAVEGGLTATADPTEVARALRRAVMARVQDVMGPRAILPRFFTGHDREGSPGQTDHSHLTFQFDPGTARLVILAPHVADRRDPTPQEIANLKSLDAALTHFRELRAGSSGCLTLRASLIEANADPLFGASRVWESATPYQATRHAKHVGAAEALIADMLAECRRRGLPEPHITPRESRGVPGVGLLGGARLTFEVAVQGPLVLGRSRHLGGGLFRRTTR